MGKKNLESLLNGVEVKEIFFGEGNKQEKCFVRSLSCDSRKVASGGLFFAVSGSKIDGKQFIPAALEQGVSVVVTDSKPVEYMDLCKAKKAIVVSVFDIRKAIAQIAASFYSYPASKLRNYGVTGTNGKTSIVWLMSSLISLLDSCCASVGTLGLGVIKHDGQNISPCLFSTANTSPEPILLHNFLSSAVSSGCKSLVSEVTSQAIEHKRFWGIDWTSGIFTNLTRDHLDIHGTMERYSELKKIYFTKHLYQSSLDSKSAVINADDHLGRVIIQELKVLGGIKVFSFSRDDENSDSYVIKDHVSLDGTEILANICGNEVCLKTRLLGDYNISNVLAAVTCLYSQGYSLEDISNALPKVSCVSGRLEKIGHGDVLIFVDYAHTPDALINVQKSLRCLCSDKQLITVFGCGGDRDKGKRPLMGEAVARLSDFVVVTSDNPRNENPETIISDIMLGLSSCDKSKYKIIVDREEAIAYAISCAKPGDVVLVAGKGHEDYQEIQGVKHPFSDAEVCRKYI